MGSRPQGTVGRKRDDLGVDSASQGRSPGHERTIPIYEHGAIPPNSTGQWAGFRVRRSAFGLHLFNRVTGVNVLLDEVRPRQSTWSLAPRQVSIALINACDLECSFCYAPKHAAALDGPLVKSWLKELDANGCLSVGFGGGEPTLHPEFPELCAFARGQTGLAVTFTTHAHRLSDRLLALLEGNVHFVRVSMDGIGTTYERVRGRPFVELVRRLEQVRALAPFGVNTVVNEDTVGDLDGVVAIAAEAGASEILLLPERSVRGSPGIGQQAMARLRAWVATTKSPIRLAVSESGSAGLETCRPVPGEVGLNAYAHIDASGCLRGNSFDPEGVDIECSGVMAALQALRDARQEART